MLKNSVFKATLLKIEIKKPSMGLNSKNNFSIYILLAFFICLLISGCFKDITQRTIVYKNNFEDSSKQGLEIFGPNGKVDSIKRFHFNNSLVFGRFKDNAVLFKLDQLPTHNVIKIEFDLYLHDNWKGNFIAPGSTAPDIWQLKLDNNAIYETTFSNGNEDQSFPDNYNYQPVPIKHLAFSNAWGKLDGVCSKAGQKDGTSYYKIECITSHQGPIELVFQDISFTASNHCQKTWSIDNLKLTAITIP